MTTTQHEPGPVIPGPGASAEVALAPLVEADQAIEAALVHRAQLYAAAIDAGWSYSVLEAVTGYGRSWIHTLVKRARAGTTTQ